MTQDFSPGYHHEVATYPLDELRDFGCWVMGNQTWGNHGLTYPTLTKIYGGFTVNGVAMGGPSINGEFSSHVWLPEGNLYKMLNLNS